MFAAWVAFTFSRSSLFARNAFKKILCRFLCNKAEPSQPGALVRMGLVPFAPHTVAIGLADRFPPAAVVTAASENSQVRSRLAAPRTVVYSGLK